MAISKRKAHEMRMAECYAEARAIVATGKCPLCGSPLRYNNAMSGWWQCVAVGAPAFRGAAYRNLPACSFQTFTQ